MTLTISGDRASFEGAVARKFPGVSAIANDKPQDTCQPGSIAERPQTFGHLRIGLISTTGVPSIASIGPIRSRVPSIARTTTG